MHGLFPPSLLPHHQYLNPDAHLSPLLEVLVYMEEHLKHSVMFQNSVRYDVKQHKCDCVTEIWERDIMGCSFIAAIVTMCCTSTLGEATTMWPPGIYIMSMWHVSNIQVCPNSELNLCWGLLIESSNTLRLTKNHCVKYFLWFFFGFYRSLKKRYVKGELAIMLYSSHHWSYEAKYLIWYIHCK